MPKKSLIQKLKEARTIYALLFAFLFGGSAGGGGVIVVGKGMAWNAVRDSVQATVDTAKKETVCELEKRQNVHLAQIAEMMTGIDGAKEKAEEMKEEGRAKSVILEALKNGDN